MFWTSEKRQTVEYGTVLNICSDNWLDAHEENCPILGGKARFDFGEAIKYMKRGFKVCREGWNGKKQYIHAGKRHFGTSKRRKVKL